MRNNEDNQTTFGIILVIGFTIMGPVMDTFAKLAANEIPIGQISFSRFFIQSMIIIPVALYLKILYFPVKAKFFFIFPELF